jgi:hypothetical protein
MEVARLLNVGHGWTCLMSTSSCGWVVNITTLDVMNHVAYKHRMQP